MFSPSKKFYFSDSGENLKKGSLVTLAVYSLQIYKYSATEVL